MTLPPLTIGAIDVIPLRLPLREPFVIAYSTAYDTPTILVRIRTTDGAEGWGEATPDQMVTGETWSSTTAMIRDDLAPALIGADARDRDAAMRLLDARVGHAPAAKAAFDIALHDLVATVLGVPLWALLGGRSKPHLEISRVVSIAAPEEMAAAAERHVAAGFHTVKLKVGDPANPALDVRRVLAVREAIGPDIALKIDVNQGWRTPGVAIPAVRGMLPANPRYIEQPVAAWDIEGLADVRRMTGATIMIDEGVHGPHEMHRVVALRAADLVNIKLMKTGGIANAIRTNTIAEAAGIVAQIGTMVESSIASAAGLHTALALANVETVEMGGPLMHADDIGDLRDGYAPPKIRLTDRPGLGVALDLEKIRRYSAAWTEVTA
ncbi:MAG: mandelate racemase/muconate lactonizing enzyme family protein [Thermomicrobiales bacterium]